MKLEHYLVIGSGNIAKRHIKNLKILFPQTPIIIVTRSGRVLEPKELALGLIEITSLNQALENYSIKGAIVANPAPWHLSTSVALLKKNVPVLIEKPLTDSLNNYQNHQFLLQEKHSLIEIGYNLRYLPALMNLKKILPTIGTVYSVVAEVGQLLSQWRPGDYRQSVSAQKKLGGGALLELSHEIDYLRWLFGDFTTVSCQMSCSGALDIDVEDVVDAFLIQNKLTVNLHMDFLQTKAHRKCKIIGQKGTLLWNVLKNTIELQTDETVTAVFDQKNYDYNQMYLEELVQFDKLVNKEVAPLINLEQGLAVLRLIDALKISYQQQKTVSLSNPRLSQ